MFCGECGTKLNDNAKFCKNCGNPVIREEESPKIEPIFEMPEDFNVSLNPINETVQEPLPESSQAEPEPQWEQVSEQQPEAVPQWEPSMETEEIPQVEPEWQRICEPGSTPGSTPDWEPNFEPENIPNNSAFDAQDNWDNESDQKEDKKDSKGLIIGLIIGGILLVAAIIGGIFVLRGMKAKDKENANSNTAIEEAAETEETPGTQETTETEEISETEETDSSVDEKEEEATEESTDSSEEEMPLVTDVTEDNYNQIYAFFHGSFIKQGAVESDPNAWICEFSIKSREGTFLSVYKGADSTYYEYKDIISYNDEQLTFKDDLTIEVVDKDTISIQDGENVTKYIRRYTGVEDLIAPYVGSYTIKDTSDVDDMHGEELVIYAYADGEDVCLTMDNDVEYKFSDIIIKDTDESFYPAVVDENGIYVLKIVDGKSIKFDGVEYIREE